MEYIGVDPGAPGAPVYGTLHWGYSCYQDISDGNFTTENDTEFPDDFHIYSVEWSPEQINWFVDDVVSHLVLLITQMYQTVPNSKFTPSVPFYIILNTAVGGYWPGPPDAQTVFPQYRVIDYVKVYTAS